MSDLFAEFSGISFNTWKNKIVKDLKDIQFEELIRTDDNGLPVFPFYNRENSVPMGDSLFSNPDWAITQTFWAANERTANGEILSALNAGLEAVLVDFGDKKYCDYEALFKEVELSCIRSMFRVDYPAAMLVYQLKDYLQNLYPEKAPVDCSFRFDPIYNYLQLPAKFLKPVAEEYLDFFKSAGSYFQLFVDASLYQNAGASTTFQLGAAIAHLNEYIEFLKPSLTTGTALKVCVQSATGTLFYEEIAKLRALRSLVALLLEEHGLNAFVEISGVTSNLYCSPVDAYTNLLRDTISGMAAVLGGCDTLEIRGFAAAEQSEVPKDFSKHLARNQQLIFKEEAYLNKVADVGLGSFFIEKRTDDLAREAWKHFQEIESKGGLLATFDSGWLKNQMEEQAQLLVRQYREGKRILIGVNKYPNPTEEKQSFSPDRHDEKGIAALNIARELLVQEG